MPDRVARSTLRLLAAMAGVVALAAALIGLNEWFRQSALERLTAPAGSGAAAVGAPFSLASASGDRVTDGDFRGRKMLIVFADPREAERTAAALQVASAAIASLGARASGLAPVLVSLDTSADARVALARLLAGLPVAWTGLWGGGAEIERLARAYFVPLPTDPPRRGAPPVGPPVAHLLDEAGRFLAHTPIVNDPDGLAEWLQRKL